MSKRTAFITRVVVGSALVVGLAAAPAAQQRDIDDADEPRTQRGQVQAPVQPADTDDRDPGGTRFVERAPAQNRIVSDQDADAVVRPGPVSPATIDRVVLEALDNGRDGQPTRTAAVVVRSESAVPLDNGRGLAPMRTPKARSVSDPNAPLDNGRSAAAHPEQDQALVVDAEAPGGAPAVLTLGSVLPNPLGDRATVTVSVASASQASVVVYDVQGRLVATLFDGGLDADAPRQVALDGRALTPGVYVVVLRASGYTASRTFQVVR
ncbi:T9SS type A sorting domain-containing protein [Rubrivirga sp. IMCC43871]|uniref:T9SS type A sorting domain-containing protein n=1 Tax=Rubrivirga sp. IMCC43871 TaxID=3391575 RepID=UPI0039903791